MRYENEEQIRKDFARLFGWTERSGMYDSTIKYRTPEWAEIFCKVGELLERSSEPPRNRNDE